MSSQTGKRLEIDHLSKRYGSVVALDDMTFEVRAGEVFGFVGSNGAGKTTTMRIVLGVLSPDAGEVRWDGHAIDTVSRRRIGYMPEERGLYPKMRVGQQLDYFARLHGLTSAEARAASVRWAERLGVAGRLGDEVQALSLGNQQRVQLAAALVHDPAILVLDEPFSGLDPVAVDVMSQVLAERAAAGVPVIFSSHQLDLVQRICDRVGIVRAGRMVASGSVDELRSGSAAQLVVTVSGGTQAWAAAIPGVTVQSADGGTMTLSLADGVDDQVVLRAALATGPVTEFYWRRPDLTELFRHVVTTEVAA
jgi:ABC-2 type transport system ATP-binding protein